MLLHTNYPANCILYLVLLLKAKTLILPTFTHGSHPRLAPYFAQHAKKHTSMSQICMQQLWK